MNQELPFEEVKKMHDALDELLENAASLINAHEHEPSPDSLALKELEQFQKRSEIETAQDQSYLLLESSSDYLSSLFKSLTKPVETIAPWALARGVMETAAISIWIGRPDISAFARAKRSLAFQFKGLQERSKMSKDSDLINSPKDESYNKLANRAKEINAELKEKEGKITKVGTHMPSTTKLCESQLKESSVYRLLSAMTHSHSFAVQELGVRIIGPSKNDENRFDAEKHLSNNAFSFICSFTGRFYLRALSARLKYFGYLKGEVVKTLRDKADKLLLTEEEFRYCIWSK